jgi:hypothetical protein
MAASSSGFPAGLGGDQEAVLGLEAERLLDFLGDLVDAGGGKVDLVDDGDDGEVFVDGEVGVDEGLGLHALRGVDDEDGALAGLEGAGDFVVEVDVPGGVDEVEHEELAVGLRRTRPFWPCGASARRCRRRGPRSRISSSSALAPGLWRWKTVTAEALMVMPRSRSMSIESRIWSRASRAETALVAWRSRSARVLLPWSMWAMMEKLRICSGVSVIAGDGREGSEAAKERASEPWKGGRDGRRRRISA